MANYIISDCLDENLRYIASYGGTDIIIGNTYYLTFSDELLPSGCYKIEDEDVQIGFVSILTVTPYDSCYDCLSNNNYFVRFQNCTGSGVDGAVLISDFGSSPIVGQVYYFSFTEYSTVYTDCFIITNIITSPKEVGFLLTTPVLQTGCETCLSSNSLPYRVTRCTDSIVDYVMLINDSLNGHLISYSDGINQYCGVVNNQETGSPEMTFITDYGPSIDVECPTCLSTVNQKVLLQSCTDVEYQEVVWASSLYGVGEISNLSTSSGCFEIVGPTENPITINNFLNFDPQPGCNACIECNGIYYSFVDCNDQPFGSILSYEYLSAGTVVFDTNFNKCLKINGITNSANDISYSYISFNDCNDCLENNVNVDIWLASACTISGQYTQFFVTTIGPVSTGDTVKLMWGSNEWVCVTLLENLPYGSGQFRGTIYSAKRNELNQTITYESCESCNTNSTIGITLTTCDAPYTESFVQISLENYLSIYNFGSLQNTSVSDVDGKCYRIINLCPIPLTATTEFTPVKFYYSCTLCKNDNNYIPPRSANTETFLCQEICVSGGTTTISVVPPHPVWTDGYGTQVTQLNMITLGGPNGLNN